MNLSGKAILLVSNFYNIDISNILIAHDELDLLPGHFKFKTSFGHGGHNGVRNFINSFKTTKNFFKISIGIGRPNNKCDVASFVLSNPNEKETLLIKKSINKAVSLIINIINNMNEFN